MAKKFYLSEKQNIKLDIPEKYQSVLGVSSICAEGSSEASHENTAKKKKKKSGFDLNILIRVVAFTLMFCSLAMLCNYAVGYLKDIELNKAIEEEYGVSFETDKIINNVTPDATVRPVPEYPIEDEDKGGQKYNYPQISSIDGIKKLEDTYKDFVYWLYLEDTAISYAVVQSKDNDYYLRRNINGETNLSGTLFLDYRNEPEMEYGNNIIYGHNMQNGTMFGGLKKYRDKKYFDAHQMMYTYTSDEVTAWKIFSVYETTTENYYIQTSFVNKDNYYEFINGLQRNSIHKTDVKLESSSTVLTLSTCHKYDYDNGRFVVHAVKMFTAPIS